MREASDIRTGSGYRFLRFFFCTGRLKESGGFNANHTMDSPCVLKSAAIFAALVVFASCSGGDGKTRYQKELENATLLSVRLASEGKTYLIDASGKSTPVTSGVINVGVFHDDLAVALDSATQLYGYINRSGQWEIKPAYASATDFSEGMAGVAVPDSSLTLINTSGKVKVSLPADVMSLDVMHDGIMAYEDIEGRKGLIDSKGQKLLGGKMFRRIGAFDRKYANVFSDENSWRVVGTKTGDVWLEGRFNDPTPVCDGKYMVVRDKDGRCGLALSKNGELLINPRFKRLYFDGEMFVFENEKGKYGRCDKNGDIVIPAKYDKLKVIEGAKYFIASMGDGKTGVINGKGEKVILAKYRSIEPAIDGCFFVETDEGWGIVNAKGEVTAEPQFKRVEVCGKIAIASNDYTEWGVVDMKGHFNGRIDWTLLSELFVTARSQKIDASQVASLLGKLIDKTQPTVGKVKLSEMMEEYRLYNSTLSLNPRTCVQLSTTKWGNVSLSLDAMFEQPTLVSKRSGYYSRKTTVPNENVKPSYYWLALDAPVGTFINDVVSRLLSAGKMTKLPYVDIIENANRLNVYIYGNEVTFDMYGELGDDGGGIPEDEL